MRHILGALRRCDEQFNLIKDGDNIAVAVSGGKDSIALLKRHAALPAFFQAEIRTKGSIGGPWAERLFRQRPHC